MDSVRLVTSVNQSVADSKSFISVSVNTAYSVLLAWEFAFLFYLIIPAFHLQFHTHFI